MTGRARKARRAIVLAAFSMLGCDLLAPVSRDSYTLIRIDGQPLPVLGPTAVSIDSDDTIQVIETGGRLEMFVTGRFVLENSSVWLLQDGTPWAERPDTVRNRFVGLYTHAPGGTFLDLGLSVTGWGTSDTLVVRDSRGLDPYFEYIYVRR